MPTLHHNMLNKLFLFTLLILLVTPVMAAEKIGVVLLSVGNVTATDSSGAERALKRRGILYEGDTLTTAEGANCQIRFTDGSLLALPANSQFRVDEYQFGAAEGENEKAIYSLLKGGMRTITGAIGKKKPENYRVNTPVATIGIRGTAYHAFIYRLPSGEIQLYGGVQYGMIAVDNQAGSTLFATDQNFRVLSASEQAEIISSLPDFYPQQSGDEGSDEQGVEGEEGEETTSSNGEETQVTDEQLTDDVPVTTDNSGTEPDADIVLEQPALETEVQTTVDGTNATPSSSVPAPNGSLVGVAFVGSDLELGTVAKAGTVLNISPNEIYLDTVDGVGNVPVGLNVYETDCNPCTFVPGTATLVDHGGHTIGINWGRWEGDFIVTENGILDTTKGSFHYIYTPNVTPLSVVQARTGFAYYSLAGGTSPTDQDGTVGTLDGFYMDVDFDNQKISNTSLYGTVGTTTFSAYSPTTTTIQDALDPNMGIQLEDISNNLEGHVHMQFVGNNAEGIAATYGLQDINVPSGTAITGTALLLEGSPAF